MNNVNSKGASIIPEGTEECAIIGLNKVAP
jgi:hypothetical protein